MERLKKLRAEMSQRQLTIWAAETTDVHKNEYIADCDNYVKYLSGFTGENATLIVTQDEAKLWVDGRFFLQAPAETEGRGIEVMKLRQEGVPTVKEWLEAHGFSADIREYEDPAPVLAIWPDRPARPANKIKVHDFEWNGQPADIKMLRVCEMMNIKGVKEATFCRLDDIAWVLNLRGSDIPYNPVFYAFLHITIGEAVFAGEKDFSIDFEAELYLQHKALTTDARKQIEKCQIKIRDYEEFTGPFEDCDIIREMKNVKSPIELFHIKECHVRDGIYMSKFIAWIKKSLREGKRIDETEAAEYLDKLRRSDGYFLNLSFPTICGYGENAAIIHYTPSKKTAKQIEPHGLLLVDSGAAYLDGTTDVTRTIACGPLSAEEKLHYTLVLQAWLRLMHASWKAGEDSTKLDKLVRRPIKRYDLDFPHGAGHGVGYANMVHEGPARISSAEAKDTKPYTFVGGEVVSDEPGIYIEGKHGVRIENLLYCKEQSEGILDFENLTLVPVELDAIDETILTEEDKENLGKYMMLVRVIVGSYLNEDELSILFK